MWKPGWGWNLQGSHRSLDFIWVASGSFKQISCKDITQTYLHFKKFLLHCGEWLQGEQEWKLSARLGGWTSFQEQSVSHTHGRRGSGKKALKWMHILDTDLRELASGLGLAAWDDDGGQGRWSSKRTSKCLVGGGPPSGGVCWAGGGQAEAWGNQEFKFDMAVCGMPRCLVILGNRKWGAGHRDKVWAEGRKYGWYLNPWKSTVFHFMGVNRSSTQGGRKGPRTAIFRHWVAEIRC